MHNQSEIRKLSNDWVSTSLGELSEYITSGSRDWKKYYSSAGALFIRTQDINKNRLALEKTARVDLPKKVEGKRTRVRKGDLLITITGANVGKIALVENDIEEAYVSQSVALVRLKNKDLGRYVHHHLMAREGAHTYLETAAYGMGRPVLNLKNVREVPIRLAPQEQRESIVAEIEKQFSRLDEAVTCLKRAKANLKRYKAAVLKAGVEGKLTEEWRKQHPDIEPASELLKRILAEHQFANSREKGNASVGKQGKNYPPLLDFSIKDLPGLPHGWIWVTLDLFLAEIKAGKSFKCEERPPEFPECGVVKVSAVTWGKYNDLESKTCLNPDLITPNIIIREGDFLFSRANTIDLVGACVIAENISRKVMLSDKILRFRFIKDDLENWTLHFLRSNIGRYEIERLATGNQESMHNIGQKRIREIRIPLPAEEEMQVIVQEIERKLSQVSSIKRDIDINIHRALQLKSLILKMAYRGDLIN